jgi:hypothetical protein
MNWLQESFFNIPTIDNRIPWLVFKIRDSPSWLQFLQGEWRLYAPNFVLWNMLILVRHYQAYESSITRSKYIFAGYFH